jgi:hypothetical protein
MKTEFSSKNNRLRCTEIRVVRGDDQGHPRNLAECYRYLETVREISLSNVLRV